MLYSVPSQHTLHSKNEIYWVYFTLFKQDNLVAKGKANLNQTVKILRAHINWFLFGCILPATYKKETPAQVFSCEYCQIFKSSIFYRTLLVVASIVLYFFLISQNIDPGLDLDQS